MSNQILHTESGDKIRYESDSSTRKHAFWLQSNPGDDFPRVAFVLSFPDGKNFPAETAKSTGRQLMEVLVAHISSEEPEIPAVVDMSDISISNPLFLPAGTKLDIYYANKRRYYKSFPGNTAIIISTEWNASLQVWDERKISIAEFPSDRIGANYLVDNMKRLHKGYDFIPFRDAIYIARGTLHEEDAPLHFIFDEPDEEDILSGDADAVFTDKLDVVKAPSWLAHFSPRGFQPLLSRSARFAFVPDDENAVVGNVNNIPGGLPFFARFNEGGELLSKDQLKAAAQFLANELKNGRIPYPKDLNQTIPNGEAKFETIGLWFATRAEIGSPLYTHNRMLFHFHYDLGEHRPTNVDVWKYPSNEDLIKREEWLLEKSFPYGFGESPSEAAYVYYHWCDEVIPETISEISEIAGVDKLHKFCSRTIPNDMAHEFASALAAEKEALELEEKREAEAKRKKRTANKAINDAKYLERAQRRIENYRKEGLEELSSKLRSNLTETKESEAEEALIANIKNALSPFIHAVSQAKLNTDAFDDVCDLMKLVIEDSYITEGFTVESVHDRLGDPRLSITISVSKQVIFDEDDDPWLGMILSARIADKTNAISSISVDCNIRYLLPDVDRRFAFMQWSKQAHEAALRYARSW